MGDGRSSAAMATSVVVGQLLLLLTLAGHVHSMFIAGQRTGSAFNGGNNYIISRHNDKPLSPVIFGKCGSVRARVTFVCIISCGSRMRPIIIVADAYARRSPDLLWQKHIRHRNRTMCVELLCVDVHNLNEIIRRESVDGLQWRTNIVTKFRYK